MPFVSSSPSARPVGSLALLGALTFFWGANWPFMKMALSEIPVWWFRSFCLFGGGTALMSIAWLSGQVIRLRRDEVTPLLACTLFNVIGWHLLTGYGVSHMPAGRAVIIAFTMPVWASIMSSFVLHEPLTRNKVISLVLGISALAVLVGPDLLVFETAPLGAFLMLGAAVSWAIGTVSFKRPNWSASISALAGWQLLLGGIPIALGAIFIEQPLIATEISSKAWWSLGYVVAFPMIFCQWAYFRSVRTFPASLAAISTLGIPVVGAYSSALILGESVGTREFAALVLVCMALGSVLLLPALKGKSKRHNPLVSSPRGQSRSR